MEVEANDEPNRKPKRLPKPAPGSAPFPKRRLQASYDEAGDVLYVNFGRQPRPATDSDLTGDDIIVRYDGEEVIGITILHASQQ